MSSNVVFLSCLNSQIFLAANGAISSGGNVYTYANGTLTAQTTYTSVTGGTANPNPIPINSSGVLNNEIWIQPGTAIRVRIVDAANNLLQDIDQIPGVNDLTSAGYVTYTYGTYLSANAAGAVNYGIPQTTIESNAGVTPSNTQYNPGDVRRYGADPTGTVDSSVAIQSALNCGQDVYLPSGTYLSANALNYWQSGQIVYGDGFNLSIISVTGNTNAFTSNQAGYMTMHMRDLSISGTANSGDGITSGSASLYLSTFTNVEVVMGGDCFYFPSEFNTTLYNCQGSSYGGNVFELQGGNSTKLIGCYAHAVPLGFYGYRFYAAADLDACTGIDQPLANTGLGTGGDWGLFGGTASLATFTGSISGNTLTVTNLSGSLLIGYPISGTNVPSVPTRTVITGYISGNGTSNGTYSISTTASLTSRSMTAGDPENAQYQLLMKNCDVEDFNDYGIRMRYGGTASVQGGLFTSGSNQYISEIFIEGQNGGEIRFENFLIEGGGNRLANTVITCNQYPTGLIGNQGTGNTVSVYNGATYNIPVIISKYVATAYSANASYVVNVNGLWSNSYTNISGTTGISGTSTNASNLRGKAAFGSNTTTTVSFATAEADANYYVLLGGDGAVGGYLWVTSKASTGFTINCSASNSANVDWLLIR